MVFLGDEVIGLGLGDIVVGLIDGFVIGLVGAGADCAGIGLRHHIGKFLPLCLFPSRHL